MISAPSLSDRVKSSSSVMLMRYLIVATRLSHILKFKYQKIADRLFILNERAVGRTDGRASERIK